MGLTMDNGQLGVFERNNYFYGKLMTERDFGKEQEYFNSKRWLINRLLFGHGVQSGLKVELDPDQEGLVQINPGVACDRFGREIVVPEAQVLNPSLLTDEEGQPVGDALTEGTVEICLAYAEAQTDPVPVLVPDCDNAGACASNTIREGFYLLVRLAEGEPANPPTCQLGEFPLPPNGVLHDLLCERISTSSSEVPPEAGLCVALARVTLPLSAENINICAGRPLIYNNTLLYELLLCLANRVDQLAQEVDDLKNEG